MAKIIMDSTTDLPEGLVDEYGIEILPLRVNIDSKEYLDKKTITVEEVYRAMKRGIRPVTSLPNPIDMYKMLSSYAKNGEDFIFYSFSSRMSSTYETVYLAIEELKEKYPGVRMEIIDSKGGSMATGLIVLQAAKLLEAGFHFDDVVKISKENVENIEHVFTIDDLNWLNEGGRISKGEALFGTVLNIKPILDVQDGEICVIDKVRGRKKSLLKVVEIMNERIDGFQDQIIGITHADDEEVAYELKGMVADELGHKDILVDKIGSVLGTHLGIGGVGMYFLNKRPEEYINEI